jgi:PAS domain S-box-containing protein
VTDSRNPEERISETEQADERSDGSERFRALIEASRDLITIIDHEGTIRYASPSASRTVGYRPEEMVGTNAFLHVHPDDVVRVRVSLAEILSRATTVPITFRFRHRDGSWRVFEVVGNNRVTDPAVGGIVLNSRDVTDLRTAEEAIQKLMRAVEHTENAIFMTDPEGTITYVNPAFGRLYGFTREESLGQTPRILKSGRYEQTFYERFWQRLLAGESVHGEFVNRTRDGRLVTVEMSISSVLGFDGERIGFIAVQNDITGRKLLEERFRHTQKMEAVGQLAAGVAHDFNNLLTAILGYAGLLAARLGEGSALNEELDEIRKAAESAASLTRQLLAFSRKQALEPARVNLNEIVESMRKMLQRLVGENIEVVTVLDDAIGTVLADAGQIEQVILNLAMNARDAMPRGGTLTIETVDTTLDGNTTTEQAIRPGPYVLLAVTDTGIGMDVQTQSRVFDPFFTTKPKGKGTGLGLATVYGIVKQSGGCIWVYSELGRGTTFKIYLPCVEGSAESALARKPAAASLRGTETVLLAEDEPSLRALIRTILESYGYCVLESGGAEEALELAKRHEGPIHILLTDVVLPDMDGTHLAARIAELRPETKVLCTSGYTGDTMARRGLLAEGARFLQKPFAPATLAATLREMLASET